MYYCGRRIKTKNHVYGPEIRSHFLLLLVEEGCAVLHAERFSIKEIAHSVGIEDPLYFSRVFRKREGVSPNKYRLQLQKEHEVIDHEKVHSRS